MVPLIRTERARNCRRFASRRWSAGPSSRALRNADYVRFDASRFRDEANLTAAKMAHGFYTSLFEQNLFYSRLRELGGAIGNAAMEWPSAGETGRFSELVSRMQEIETAAAMPQMEWAFRPTFSLGREFDRVVLDEQQSRRVVMSVPQVLGSHHIRTRGTAE